MDQLAGWGGAAAGLSGLLVVGFAVPQLITLGRQQRSASLLRVIEELRDDEYLECAQSVYNNFPIPTGITTTEQVEAFILHAQSVPQDAFLSAKKLINRFNNIAQLIDSRVIDERDLHGQTHPTVIELAARLDPFIVASSAFRGYRWGMRVRRLGAGASNYWRLSTLHREKPFTRDGVVLVPSTPLPWRQLVRVALRARIRGRYMPRAYSQLTIDDSDVAAASGVLGASNLDVEFLRP
jgi:hypothetical protein